MRAIGAALTLAAVGAVAATVPSSHLRHTAPNGIVDRHHEAPAIGPQSLPSSCSGKPNTYPIVTASPTLVNRTAYGSRYEIKAPLSVGPPLSIIHVYGSPYMMGYGYGSLMKDEIGQLIPQAYEYIYQEINSTIGFLPAPVRNYIEKHGVQLALNLTFEATKNYIPQHYFELVHGMAAGSGQQYMDIFRIALFPELIKASCSLFGAWGDATSKADGIGLVQLRALDWTTSGPFQQFPLVINYHPEAGNGYNFSVLTWAGLVGAISGFSSSGMAISEKVWIHYPGIENIVGYPFHFLLQDILQYDMDTDQALSRIASANRTCSIFIGLGDKYNDMFKAVEYSWEQVHIFNPRNFPIYPDHDRFKDLVFVDKHTQPSHHPCMNDLMHQFYGALSPENTLRYVTAGLQTGDMHVAIYDFENSYMYVSNASPSCPNCTAIPAYNQQFIRLDMEALWTT